MDPLVLVLELVGEKHKINECRLNRRIIWVLTLLLMRLIFSGLLFLGYHVDDKFSTIINYLITSSNFG